MNTSEAKELLDKYLKRDCSPEEKALIERAYNRETAKADSQLSEKRYLDLKAEMWDHLQYRKPHKKVFSIWFRAAAASLLIFLSMGGYFYLQNKHTTQFVQQVKHDILPGSNKATLTLADGRKIILTGANNGLLANEGHTNINKTQDGQVVYDGSSSSSDAIVYNNLATPKGGQYHLTLSDGTGVWLNAASSIRYPAAFTKNYREVQITGEVYFEVAHDAAKPFRVIAKNQKVEVLGTHFNVNAYDDEAEIITTLLQGSVSVSKNGSTLFKRLSPGQQAVFAADNILVSAADTEQAVAWKNGEFQFDGDIRNIMRQVARWYNVDVSFKGAIPNNEFVAVIPRTRNISEVLKALQLTGKIHFKIEERSVIVMP